MAVVNRGECLTDGQDGYPEGMCRLPQHDHGPEQREVLHERGDCQGYPLCGPCRIEYRL